MGSASLNRVARKGPTVEATLDISNGGGEGAMGDILERTTTPQTERRSCTKVLE